MFPFLHGLQNLMHWPLLSYKLHFHRISRINHLPSSLCFSCWYWPWVSAWPAYLMHWPFLSYKLYFQRIFENKSASFFSLFLLFVLSMGRRKHLMMKIDNPSLRHLTYSKRRDGILKKVVELSVLCEAEIGLLMFSPTGQLTVFASNGRLIWRINSGWVYIFSI